MYSAQHTLERAGLSQQKNYGIESLWEIMYRKEAKEGNFTISGKLLSPDLTGTSFCFHFICPDGNFYNQPVKSSVAWAECSIFLKLFEIT